MDLHDLNRHVGEFLRNTTPAEKGVACGVQGLFAFESIRPEYSTGMWPEIP